MLNHNTSNNKNDNSNNNNSNINSNNSNSNNPARLAVRSNAAASGVPFPRLSSLGGATTVDTEIPWKGLSGEVNEIQRM